MDTEEGQIESNTKLSGLVESNCQFLTCIRHNHNKRTDTAKKNLPTLEGYMQNHKCKLNVESFLQLIIELSYFLYACKNNQATPVIEQSIDIRVQQLSLRNMEKRFSVVIWYRIQESSMQDGKAREKLITLLNYLFEKLEESLFKLKEDEKDKKLPHQIEMQTLLQNFRIQLGVLIGDEFYSQNEISFFKCLQYTNIFYELSIFYRIKNSSILDFIRTQLSRFEYFRIAKAKDQNFVIEYNKEKNRGKSEQQVLRNKQREIENNISHFFKSINQKNYFQIQSKNEKDALYRVKFNYTLSQRERYTFQEMSAAIQGRKALNTQSVQNYARRPPMQYFIQYSSQKNHICVKLYNPSIVSNVQSSDFLIFQSNALTFEAVNVSIELSEPKLKGQVWPKKVVTFKGSSSFNIKEPPLEKILLLMDITMIACKIYEPELNLNRLGYTTGKDFQRLAKVSKKIGHYTKMFMKLAKKIYSE